MSEHRYPARSLMEDYARGAAGLAFLAVALVPMHWVLHLIFGLVALMLLSFGVRTLLRGKSRVVLDEAGIAVIGPISWAISRSTRCAVSSTARPAGVGR